ncbi:MAG TPA: hypothetical protein VI935_07150 [Thermodesulfobacteriota bacterium]|nr:hypothetical protein [Thermodesulfobacteriota bacterium]
MEKPEILGIALFPALVISTLIIALSCGPNPPFAPQGSTITILNPLDDITIPPESLQPTFRIQAFVTDPDGNALNSVRVRFSLSFADQNSLVVDTDGDGESDSRALQLVDNSNCNPNPCDLTPISQWFQQGAFVDSPYTELSNDRGIAEIIILIPGPDVVIVDPAVFEASLDNGSPPDNFQFSVNAGAQ